MTRKDKTNQAESPVAPEVTGLSALDAALSYLPRTLLEELASNPDRPLPWLTQIDGTMVMGDISGFTAMSEQLAKAGREGAEQLTDIINSFFGTMLDIAGAYGGDTLTFGGDAILLLFRGDDHARRAAASSLDMLAATDTLDPFRVRNKRIKLGMSMGAHSGRFSLVAAGSEDTAQFLSIGPQTVRTAQAEGAASSGELAVSTETLDALGRAAYVKPLDLAVWQVVDLDRSGIECAGGAGGLFRPAEPLVRPYLPPFATEAIAGGGTPPALPGEHRTVTIVFVNVTGVDELLGQPDPGPLLTDLQTYVTHALASIESHDGYLVSNDIYTDGFKLIVAFGAPRAHEHDAENAVRFALDLRNRIAEADLGLRHRFGINRGPVYAGDVGAPHRRQYTVMGDAVNLSARLMSHSEMGGALTTRELARAVGSSFICEDLAPIRVKGKEHPIAVCSLRSQTDVHVPRTRTDAPLTGRKDELARMRAALATASRGTGQAVLLQGEAGMGKSRLADELVHDADAHGWRLLQTACYRHTKATPYAPWLPLLGQLLCVDGGMTDRERRTRVRDAVRQLAPEHEELASLLGPLVDAELPESQLVRGLDTAARRRALFELVAALVSGAAAGQPTLLSVEDTHWADSSSIALLSAVAEACLGHKPLLLLLSERSLTEPTVGLPPGHTTRIPLAPLAKSDAESLLGEIPSLAGIPEVIARAIVDRANGNPLFLEELARSVRDSGLARRLKSASPVAVEQALSGLDFPDRIETLLMSRIDLLEPPAKETLRRAAVIGQVFEPASLLALEPSESIESVGAQLHSLASLDLVEPLESGTPGYRFAHALVQEVAYGSLRFDTRRELHHKFAAHLEALWSDDLTPHLDDVVRHYMRSGDRPKTVQYAVSAAERADAVYAHKEAIDYYRIAKENQRSRTPGGTWARSRLLERVGDSLQVMGCHAEAIPVYKDALRRWARIKSRPDLTRWSPEMPAEEHSPEVRHAALCHKVARCYERANRRYDLAERWVDDGLAALPRGCASLRSHMLVTRGFSRMRQGRYTEAIADGRAAARSARRSGDTAELAWALNMLGVCYGEVGDLNRAISTDRQSVRLFEQLNDLLRLSSAYSNLAACLERRGKLKEALDYNLRSLEIDERTGSTDQAAVAHANIGEILVVHGRYAEAESHLLVALDAGLSAGSDGFAGFVLTNLARARLGMHRCPDAAHDIDRAMELLARAGARSALAEATVQQAEILLARGRVDEALESCRAALHDADAVGSKMLRIGALRTRSRALAASGDCAAACAAARESVEIARRVGARCELALALSTFAEACLGDTPPAHAAASAALREAIPILRSLEAAPALENARELRRRVPRHVSLKA